VHYLCVTSSEIREQWLDALLLAMKSRSITLHNSGTLKSEDEKIPGTDTYTYPSEKWSTDQTYRVILNSRRLCFSPREAMSLQSQDEPPALVIGRKLLELGLALGQNPDKKEILRFVDATAQLKRVDLNGLTHDERLTFFLNLYHTMIIHSFRVIGPPASVLQRNSFYSSVSYECGGFVYSLSELEYSILRAAMPPPNSFFSFLLPKYNVADAKCKFALKEPEPRINFVLNTGTLSCPGEIPVFDSLHIHEQLDAVCSRVLNTVVDVNETKQTIILPKVCQWFKDDFGLTSHACVLMVLRYLKNKRKTFLQNPNEFKIEYHDYIWEFHPSFTKMEL